MWWVHWGPHIEALQGIAEQTGVTPEALENIPQIPEPYEEYRSAFILLSSRRAVGMAACPITLADIQAYVELFGEPSFGVPTFVSIITLLDAKYLELTAKK